ncbi:hypothetical protein ACFUKV_14700 [Streptomyces paradoxus]|uniref:vWA domain-containing protein n=1 Tax=Streptomyces paradoxus TaxID=66375 RepID=UPI003637C9A2
MATQADPKGSVFPIYLAADESPSMTPWVGNLNSGLRHLLNEMHKHPMDAGKIRFSIIGFSDDARVVLDLCDLRDVREAPELSIQGTSTSYSAAFDKLRERIPQDIASCRAQGYGVLRPAIFFLTDGEPMDPEGAWRSSLNKLTDKDWRPHPNILSFGLSEAAQERNMGNIAQIATHADYAFVAAKAHQTGEALTSFLRSLMRTIVATGHNLREGKTELLMEPPEGFTRVPVELV